MNINIENNFYISPMPEYLVQSEPEDYKKRRYNWKTAIGLQAVLETLW
jgi:hypothetical protein